MQLICNFLSHLTGLESVTRLSPGTKPGWCGGAWGGLGTQEPSEQPWRGSWPLPGPPALPPRVGHSPERPPTRLRVPHSPQVFEEEHHVLYLDHGGVIVAIKDTSIPLKILK